MRCSSHAIAGISSGIALTSVLYQSNIFSASSTAIIAILGGSLIGSLIPDIDHPNSYISRRFIVISWLTNLLLFLIKVITSLILLLCFWIKKSKKEEILKMFEHRGIFHTLLFAFLITWLLSFIPINSEILKIFQFGFLTGYLSHLLMDMLTVFGVKILFPITTHTFHYPLIRLHTGKMLDEIIASSIFIFLSLVVMVITRVVF